MSPPAERHTWLEDFAYVLTAEHMRSLRHDDKYEALIGPKPLAWVCLVLTAAFGGALGGTLASGALWRSILQVALWLAVAVLISFLARRGAISFFGPSLGFLVGWNVFFGLLIGLVAMGAASRAGPGWAYGIAGGMGFLVGLLQGGYEPDDLRNRDLVLTTGLVSAPLGACVAVWLHRNLLDPSTLTAAAVTGAVAGTLSLAPSMAMFLGRLDTVRGLKRVATLLLHRDDTAGEAVRLLDRAIRFSPEDASLLDRRGLAHALSGSSEAAESDWGRVRELNPKSPAPDVARGWAHLRRGRHAEAAGSFEAALALSRRNTSALVGLGIARLRAGDAAGALESLKRVTGREHDALSMTRLAEAQLAAGDPKEAAELASVAVDELDSVFGRTWLVRAEASRALGDLDGAARDFSKAWHVAEEEGLRDRARAGLDAIGRPLEEEEEPE